MRIFLTIPMLGLAFAMHALAWAMRRLAAVLHWLDRVLYGAKPIPKPAMIANAAPVLKKASTALHIACGYCNGPMQAKTMRCDCCGAPAFIPKPNARGTHTTQ